MAVPVSTYRLQIREDFPLAKAATIAGYLRDLGIDWAYLSPLLEAETGSDRTPRKPRVTFPVSIN